MTMFGSQWLANAGATYEIEQSIRFNYVDDPSLTIDYGSAGNRRTYTYSVWLKRSNFGSFNMGLFGSGVNQDNRLYLRVNTAVQFVDVTGGAVPFNVQTNAVLRDPSSWYHVVLAVDTTDSTASNRVKIYINGTLQTSLASTSYPTENLETRINSTDDHYISLINNAGGSSEYDGYMAEINFIDGTQAAATAFGEINAATGQWVPIEFEGTYGSNGFYLKGQDSSALGDDSSGNGNDWTTSNLAANDQMSDSPTNNWCVLNSINLGTSETLANGNLEVANSASAWRSFSGTHGVSSGKWYWEATQTGTVGAGNSALIGIAEYQEADFARLAVVTKIGPAAGGYAFENWTGDKRDPAETSSSYGTAPTSGQIVGVALDLDNAKIWFSVNNTWQASGDPAGGTDEAFASLPAVEWCPAGSLYNATQTYNFGQNAFAYTPPTGFSALNNANTPDPAIADPSAYFQTTLYEGDGSTQSIDQDGNSTFSPNFVWIKNRDATDAHALFDTVRGATEVLSTNSLAAEATNADTLTAFESDGFALGDDVIVNTNAESYVAWQWNEGATPGFDIVSYSGTGANRTVAHNLGVKPGMFIIKQRGAADTNWGVYHSAVGATKSLFLQSAGAAFDSAEYFNDTEPTSSVFTLGTNAQGNANGGTYIAYVFAPVEGFSAFGSYEGNTNVNGPMTNLGFRPAWLLIKNADATGSWLLFDTARDTYNAVHKLLFGQLANVEDTSTAYLDIVSNGFKIRSTGNATNNAVTYVYAAFAENPFKTANAR